MGDDMKTYGVKVNDEIFGMIYTSKEDAERCIGAAVSRFIMKGHGIGEDYGSLKYEVVEVDVTEKEEFDNGRPDMPPEPRGDCIPCEGTGLANGVYECIACDGTGDVPIPSNPLTLPARLRGAAEESGQYTSINRLALEAADEIENLERSVKDATRWKRMADTAAEARTTITHQRDALLNRVEELEQERDGLVDRVDELMGVDDEMVEHG